jgi:hypothetical protein
MWYSRPDIPSDPEGEAATRRAAEAWNIAYADLQDIAIMEEALLKVPEAIAREQRILPIGLESDGSLVVVVDSPRELDELHFILNRKISTRLLAPRSHLDIAIKTYYELDS